MRNLLCVAVVAALGAFVYVGSADACHREKHHHHGCGAPACGAPVGCGAVASPCATSRCGTVGGCASGTCASVTGTQTATLIVSLPADAKLLIDGNETTSETARRVFETPALQAGREFEYTLQAKVVRDGKTEVITQQVTVRAGEETVVRMEMPTAVAAR